MVAIIGVLLFKKGYVTVEVVDAQENPQEEPAKEKKPYTDPYEDETIGD